MSLQDIRYSNFVVAAISTCGATCFTNPLEVIKKVSHIKIMWKSLRIQKYDLPLVSGCENSITTSRWIEAAWSKCTNLSRYFEWSISDWTLWGNQIVAKRLGCITRIEMLSIDTVHRFLWTTTNSIMLSTLFMNLIFILFKFRNFRYSNHIRMDKRQWW